LKRTWKADGEAEFEVLLQNLFARTHENDGISQSIITELLTEI
jgi:hypothetical protein